VRESSVVAEQIISTQLLRPTKGTPLALD